MRDIRHIIMDNSINVEVFSLGEDIYIVGGYLRDVILNRKSKDIDYVVRGDIKNFVHQLIEKRIRKTEKQRLLDKASIVELKKEQMIRIVLKDGSTLDFTELKGNIEDNLKERDFTMNALAWTPRTGIVDPCNGMTDIKEHRIKAVSIDNFKNDPLRLLRVYRFVSELGWDVDIKTRQMVRQLNKTLQISAYERITLEFFKLLNSNNYENALKMAMKDGLIENFLCILHEKVAGNIKSLSLLESTLKKIPPSFKIIETCKNKVLYPHTSPLAKGGIKEGRADIKYAKVNNLEKLFSQELTYKGLLRLERVLNGSALSKNRLRVSRHIFERLKIVHKLATCNLQLETASKIFDTFFEAKDALFDILILTGNIRLLKQAERFKKIWKKSFLTAEEIMNITNLKEGVKLGKLIYRLKKMQFESMLKTKKEAMQWLKNYFPA